MEIEFCFNKNISSKYTITYILPSIEFIKDLQMEEQIEKFNNDIIGGFKEYSIGLSWLFWGFWVYVKVKSI